MGCCESKAEKKQAFDSFTSTIDEKKEPIKPNRKSNVPTYGVTSFQTKSKITEDELHAFTEDLLERDFHNVTPMLTINHQGQTVSTDTDDKAPDPLLTIPSAALSGPTIKAFLRLLNNYNPDCSAIDWATAEETRQQSMFLNEIMKTEVMQYTENFLKTKGRIQKPLIEILQEIWFTTYSRTGGKDEGSSGFENVFVGEIKDKKVLGFHNWIQFGHEEKSGALDYKGIMDYVDLGNRGQVIKGRFDWLNKRKPKGTLFVGTSPEFEMALYTVCFILNPDKKIEIKLNDNYFYIQTHSLSWNHALIGGASPKLS